MRRPPHKTEDLASAESPDFFTGRYALTRSNDEELPIWVGELRPMGIRGTGRKLMASRARASATFDTCATKYGFT